MRKIPYYCPICGEKFGNTKSSRAEQRQHFQTLHPGFFDWNNRFGKIGNWFAVGSFIYVGFGLVLALVESNGSVPVWYPLGFFSIVAATFLGLLYWRLQVRSFKSSWKGLRTHTGSAPLLESTADDLSLDSFPNDREPERLLGQTLTMRLEEHPYKIKFVANIEGVATLRNGHDQRLYLLQLDGEPSKQLSHSYVLFHPQFFEYRKKHFLKRSLQSLPPYKPSLEEFVLHRDPTLKGVSGRLYGFPKEKSLDQLVLRNEELFVLARCRTI
jgi:hypothetical protein